VDASILLMSGCVGFIIGWAVARYTPSKWS
jgi:hypothetical protein